MTCRTCCALRGGSATSFVAMLRPVPFTRARVTGGEIGGLRSKAGRTGGTEGEADAFGGREGLVHRFAAAWVTSEGGVRRWVVVRSARRSARVVRGLLRAFLCLSISIDQLQALDPTGFRRLLVDTKRVGAEQD